jgi:putative membrane protein
MLTALALAAPAFGPHPGFGYGYGGGPGWLFVLIPLFWIVLLGVLFATVGRRWRRRAWEARAAHDGPARRAETVLAERYAQGDIDEVEYRARLEVLRANNPVPGYPGR